MGKETQCRISKGDLINALNDQFDIGYDMGYRQAIADVMLKLRSAGLYGKVAIDESKLHN